MAGSALLAAALAALMQLPAGGTCETMRSFGLGTLEISNLRGGRICYEAVSYPQGVRHQEVRITASGGAFSYGPAGAPLLAGTLTNLDIRGTTSGSITGTTIVSISSISISKRAFKATLRVAQYRFPPLLGGTVQLPTRRVWIENSEPIAIERTPEGVVHTSGLLLFETTDVAVAGATVSLTTPAVTWKPSLTSKGPVALALDLSGSALQLRSAKFSATAPPPYPQLEVPTADGLVLLRQLKVQGAAISVSPLDYSLSLENVGADALAQLGSAQAPLLIAGRWTARGLLARGPREADANTPLALTEVVDHAFAPAMSAAQLVASDGGPLKDLLSAVGWISPETQRQRAIAHARQQTQNMTNVDLAVYMRTDDVEPHLEKRLNELLKYLSSDVIFGRQQIRVSIGTSTLPIPVSLDLYLAPSVDAKDFLFWPAVPISAVAAHKGAGTERLSDLWQRVIGAIKAYLANLTSEPIRVPIPAIEIDKLDLTKIKPKEPEGPIRYTITITQGNLTMGVSAQNPVLIVGPADIRLFTALVLQ